jgi:hypothetical protein
MMQQLLCFLRIVFLEISFFGRLYIISKITNNVHTAPAAVAESNQIIFSIFQKKLVFVYVPEG